MSLKSMTGYGYGECSAAGVKVQVEISSVNRRQLDVHINLPRTITVLESRVLEIVHESVARGYVTGTVTIGVSEERRRRGVRVDYALAEAYVKAIRKAAAEMGLRNDLTADVLLRLPEVVQYEYVERDVERIWPLLRRALKQALRRLVDMRTREGAALALDIRTRLERLHKRHLQEIRSLAPAVTDRYQAALQQRLLKAGFAIGSEDQQVMKELALFAERCDISEEITRLDSHLKQALQLLGSREPAGRTLEFLAQELLRESNTIASKANDAAIARHVIHFKTELERIREQVQNVE